MKLFTVLAIGLVALAAPGAASAQGASRAQARPQEKAGEIPVNERPPAGMCRIWLENVPAAQQPAPTDCATAVRNRPAKGRVVFGDDYVKAKNDTSRKKAPAIKGFAPSKSKPKKPLFPIG